MKTVPESARACVSLKRDRFVALGEGTAAAYKAVVDVQQRDSN